MRRAKNLITAALLVVFLGSLAGCIIVDRHGGYRRHYHGYYHR